MTFKNFINLIYIFIKKTKLYILIRSLYSINNYKFRGNKMEGFKSISVSNELHELIKNKRIEMIGKRKIDISMAKMSEEILLKGLNLIE